jgi:hypothetical protein
MTVHQPFEQINMESVFTWNEISRTTLDGETIVMIEIHPRNHTEIHYVWGTDISIRHHPIDPSLKLLRVASEIDIERALYMLRRQITLTPDLKVTRIMTPIGTRVVLADISTDDEFKMNRAKEIILSSGRFNEIIRRIAVYDHITTDPSLKTLHVETKTTLFDADMVLSEIRYQADNM